MNKMSINSGSYVVQFFMNVAFPFQHLQALRAPELSAHITQEIFSKLNYKVRKYQIGVLRQAMLW